MEKFKIGIFEEANQFLMPETEMLDFFDFLAGQKLYLPNEEAAKLEKEQMIFKFVAKNLLPQPQAKQEKPSHYKPVKIVNIESRPKSKQKQSPIPPKNRQKMVRIKCEDDKEMESQRK